MKMIHQVERIAWVVCMSPVYTIASSIHIPYLLEQAPRRLLNFSRLKCGAYSRAALNQKLDAAKKKTLNPDYLHLLTFLSQMRRLFEGGACLGAALIPVNTVNHAKT